MNLFSFLYSEHSIVFFSLFLVVIIGYIFAILVYLYFDVLNKNRYLNQKIQQNNSAKTENIFDFKWSLISIVIWFFLLGSLVTMIDNMNTMIYFDISKYGTIYFLLSMIFTIVLHDTYFYWVHRFMHSGPMIYRLLHKKHHNSLNPTALTIYSFAPAEAILLGLYAIIVSFLFPIHWYVLVVLLIINTIANIMGHSGYEMVPTVVANSWVGKYVCVGVHHNLHHQDYRSNFGIYFHFWDNCMMTMNSSYKSERKKRFEPRK